MLRKENVNLSGSEKELLVQDYLEKGLSLVSISNNHDISVSALKSWIRQVRLQGYEALYESGRRGRAKKKTELTELEKLKAENLRLRAENALLKKVKALVEEEEARARLNGQRPSTD